MPQEWKDNIGKGQLGKPKKKGNTSSFKGKSHSEEFKKEMSNRRKGVAARTGIPFSDETKKMMSENRKGKSKQPWSEERKEARRRLLLDKKNSQEKSP